MAALDSERLDTDDALRIDVRCGSMDEKISKAPIITLLTVTAIALLAFSIAQCTQKKAEQQTATAALQAEHHETELEMRKIGEEAARTSRPPPESEEHKTRRLKAEAEMKRLDDEDKAEFCRHHANNDALCVSSKNPAQPPR